LLLISSENGSFAKTAKKEVKRTPHQTIIINNTSRQRTKAEQGTQ
jgi:hypothetical protein